MRYHYYNLIAKYAINEKNETTFFQIRMSFFIISFLYLRKGRHKGVLLRIFKSHREHQVMQSMVFYSEYILK